MNGKFLAQIGVVSFLTLASNCLAAEAEVVVDGMPTTNSLAADYWQVGPSPLRNFILRNGKRVLPATSDSGLPPVGEGHTPAYAFRHFVDSETTYAWTKAETYSSGSRDAASDTNALDYVNHRLYAPTNGRYLVIWNNYIDAGPSDPISWGQVCKSRLYKNGVNIRDQWQRGTPTDNGWYGDARKMYYTMLDLDDGDYFDVRFHSTSSTVHYEVVGWATYLGLIQMDRTAAYNYPSAFMHKTTVQTSESTAWHIVSNFTSSAASDEFTVDEVNGTVTGPPGTYLGYVTSHFYANWTDPEHVRLYARINGTFESVTNRWFVYGRTTKGYTTYARPNLTEWGIMQSDTEVVFNSMFYEDGPNDHNIANGTSLPYSWGVIKIDNLEQIDGLTAQPAGVTRTEQSRGLSYDSNPGSPAGWDEPRYYQPKYDNGGTTFNVPGGGGHDMTFGNEGRFFAAAEMEFYTGRHSQQMVLQIEDSTVFQGSSWTDHWKGSGIVYGRGSWAFQVTSADSSDQMSYLFKNNLGTGAWTVNSVDGGTDDYKQSAVLWYLGE